MPSSGIISTELREALLQRARDLVPVLKTRAADTERLRRVPDETIEDLRRAGLWSILRPVRYGGVASDLSLLIDVSAELGRGCGSTAWVYINLVSHNWMLPMWPRRAQEDIWDQNREALIGSTLVFPAGRLDPAGNGYLFSGRWPYASGVDASQWIMLGGMLREADGDGRAVPKIVLVRVADTRIIDTWHVVGLVGTGSKDVACESVFVPRHMVIGPPDVRGEATPGSEDEGIATYRIPVLAMIPHVIAGPMMGIARGAYEDYVQHLQEQTSIYNTSRVAEHTTVQLKVAEAGVLIESARLLVYDNCHEAQRYAEAGDAPPLVDRIRWRRDASEACRLCVRAVDLIHSVCGGTANYLDHDLQRRFRDIHAAAGQIHVSWDINGPEFARVALGMPPENVNL